MKEICQKQTAERGNISRWDPGPKPLHVSSLHSGYSKTCHWDRLRSLRHFRVSMCGLFDALSSTSRLCFRSLRSTHLRKYMIRSSLMVTPFPSIYYTWRYKYLLAKFELWVKSQRVILSIKKWFLGVLDAINWVW